MASAFSTSNMKAQFPNIRMACSQLMTVLKSLEIGTIVDMDNALCRESLDVIGDGLPVFSASKLINELLWTNTGYQILSCAQILPPVLHLDFD